MALTVERIVNGRWRQNCYVVGTDERHAIIIDPGDEAERIIQHIDDRRLDVAAILCTHAHHDHVGAVDALKTRLSVPLYLHSKDEPTLKHANLYRKMFDRAGPIALPDVDHHIDLMDGSIDAGGLHILATHTPGHTPGSVCFQIEDHLFTGDTLFKGKIGRVDLPGGDLEALRTSLKDLSMLRPDLKIHPGHGGPSVLGDELRSNAGLAGTIT